MTDEKRCAWMLRWWLQRVAVVKAELQMRERQRLLRIGDNGDEAVNNNMMMMMMFSPMTMERAQRPVTSVLP